MMEQRPDISIIIVNWNTKDLLLDCLSSVFDTVRKSSRETIVVDNGSTDGSAAAVARHYNQVRVIINASNQGFARANNLALRQMRGRYALLLNSDTVLTNGAVDTMREFLDHHPDVGICGPQLLNRDGSKQTSVGAFPTISSEFMSKKLMRLFYPAEYERAFRPKDSPYTETAEVDFVIGACMMVRKTAMDTVGMLDEDYFFLYEEIDWCFRMHSNEWKVCHLPDVGIYHLGGQSMKEINLRARAESWRSRYLFFQKSLRLSRIASSGLYFLGFLQSSYHLLEYTILNLITVFSLKRLRRRWLMFLYLLVWHIKGRPVSMGIPR